MKNVNNCAEMGTIIFSLPEYEIGIDINIGNGNGYCGNIQFENKEELKEFIKYLTLLLNGELENEVSS